MPVRWNHVEGSKVGMLTGLHAFGELAEIRVNSSARQVSLSQWISFISSRRARSPVTVLLLHGSGGDENDLLAGRERRLRRARRS